MTPQELKASIIELAIHGKLVAQIPEEGTGENLYEQIKMKEGEDNSGKRKGKRKNVILPISEDDIPFDVPETWKWVRLGTIGCTNTGLTYSPKDIADSGTIVLRSGNIQNGYMDYEDIVRVKMDIPENRMCHIGDILMCVRNGSERLVGKAAIIDKEGMSFGVFMAIFRSPCNAYVLHCINSAYFRNSLLGGKGKKTIHKITQNMLKNVLIPLPPLAEQKRIVAKIEELLPLIDRYEKAWNRLEDINKHFPVDIRKSIFQRAIQGKLVEQCAEEGTGEEFYQQILAEKQCLIKAGAIKEEKPLPEITEDEMPFDIPDSWKWARLGEISYFQGGYPYKSISYVPESNNQIIRLRNVKQNCLLLDAKPAYIPDSIAEATESYLIKKDDLLVTMTGTCRKKDYLYVARIQDADLVGKKLFLNQRVGRFRCYNGVDPAYLQTVLQAESIRNLIFEKETGTANQGNVGSEDMKMYAYVPLPPLAEQKRIVAKVEEIFSLCERLK